MWKAFRQLFGQNQKPIRRKPSRTRLALEALEDRVCPVADVWLPQNPNNLFWSNGGNWSLGAPPAAQQNQTAVFDGSFSLRNCIMDQNATVQGLTFQNNYQGTLNLGNPNNGQSFSLTVTNGANLLNLDRNQVNQPATIGFVGVGSDLILSGTSNFSVFNFIGGVASQVRLQSGNLNIQTPANGSATARAVSFLIGGTLNLQNSSRVQFLSGAALTVAPGGLVNISATPNSVLDDGGLGNGGIVENWGTINYTGIGATTTQVGMALLNHGIMNLSGGGAGTLQFTSQNDVPDYKYGLVMDQGNINLSQGIELSVGATGYDQEGGILGMTDTTRVEITSQTWGVEINGGVVQFTSGTGYGWLMFLGTVQWNGGTLNMRVDGSTAGNCDYISGDQFNIAAMNGPTMNVTVRGQRQNGLNWTLMWGGSGINNRFPIENLDGLTASLVGGNAIRVSSPS